MVNETIIELIFVCMLCFVQQNILLMLVSDFFFKILTMESFEKKNQSLKKSEMSIVGKEISNHGGWRIPEGFHKITYSHQSLHSHCITLEE